MQMKKNTFLITFFLLSTFTLISCQKDNDAEMAAIIENSKSNTTTAYTETSLRDNLPCHFFGLNGANVIKNYDYTEPNLRSLLEKIQPKVIRIPGGTVANYWDWHTGWFQTGLSTPINYANLPPKNNSLSALKTMIQGLDIEPIWVLNVLHATVADQIDMLKEAQNLGLPVHYVELGNEFYSDGDTDQAGNNYVTRFPTVADYVNECQNWITEIRKVFPSVEISIVGSDVRANSANDRTKLWNAGLASLLQSANVAVTMHQYKPSGVASSVSVNDFFNETNLSKIFAAPKTFANNYFTSEYIKYPSQPNVWITEYNLFQKPSPIPGSWTHALYTAIQSLELMSRPQTKFLIAHTLIAGAAFGASYDVTNAYSPSDFLVSVPNASPTKLFQLSATGEFYRLFAYAINGARGMSKLELNDTTGLFSAYSFNGAAKKKYLVLNLKSTSNTFLFTGSKFQQISALPTTRPSTTESLTITEGVPSGKVTLPPYSITVLE